MAATNFCIVTLGGYLTSALSGFNPASPAYCQITGSEGNLVYFVAAPGLKNRQEKMERSCQMSSLSPPQLPSRLPLFFSIFAAKRQREIKGGRHERRARDCASRYPVLLLSPYRYGNVESQILLAPMMHIVCFSLICLPS